MVNVETRFGSDDDNSSIPTLNSDTDSDKLDEEEKEINNKVEEEMARIILGQIPEARDEILGNQVRGEDCTAFSGFRGEGEIRVNRISGFITKSNNNDPPTNEIANSKSNSNTVIDYDSAPVSVSISNIPSTLEISLSDQPLRKSLDQRDLVVAGSRNLDSRNSINTDSRSESKNGSNAINIDMNCNYDVCDLSSSLETGEKLKAPESEIKNDKNVLRFFYANCRGYSSKRESIQQIVNDLESDICILTETNFKGTSHPSLPNMFTFFRNRQVLSMGGLAVLVNNKFKNYSVKSRSGSDGNEFMVIRFSCFKPKLAIVAMYGAQKSEGAAKVEANLHDIFFEVKQCQAAGYSVVLCGDSNIQLGRELIPNNDMCVTKAGNLFNEYMKECGLVFANNLSQDPATFVRKKEGKKSEDLRRVLDVVGVEDIDSVNEFVTDSEDLEFTPFTPRTTKTTTRRVHSDHRALNWSMKFEFTKPDSKLPPVWRYSRPLGHSRFDVVTDAGSEWMIDLCEQEEDIDVVVKKVDQFIHKSKFTAYGKMSSTRKKKEKWDEKRMWAARLELVNKMASEFEKERDNIRVWRARTIATGKNDNQVTSMRDYRTGEMLDDLEEMTNMLLDYNEETMGKEVPTPEVELLRKMKEDVIEELLSDVSEFPQHIPWEVYMKVTEKIIRQKKGVLNDFIKSGPAFKVAVFILLNKIYGDEVEPKVFKKTILTKIWKRKGSVSDISNSRFVHGRHWLGKIYEKCLVEIISEAQVRATPKFQMGGLPGRSTREHLLSAMLIMKSFTKKGKSVPVVLCDVRKCFDKLILSDLVYDAALTGADLKAIKMLQNFHQDFEIVMAGDNSETPKSRVIRRTAGQGTNAAPGLAGNSQAQTIMKNVDFRLCAKVGDVQTEPKAFVDDVMVTPEGEEEARLMGPQLTRAFDELSIKVHEEKTVIIAPGGTAAARKMRENLTKFPMKIQGNEIKVTDSDLYLGMVIHQDGVKESIESTFAKRKGKAWGQVPVIKSLIHHPQLLNEGWLGAAVTIIQGIIPATMLYSCEAWIDLTQTFMKSIEKEYKAMVYSVLEIPTHTLYAAVLAETGLMKIRHMIQRARLCYASQVIWSMEGSEVNKLLLKDLEARGDDSHLGTLRKVAKEYGLPDLTVQELDHDLVKQRVREVNDDELLSEVWNSSSGEKRVWLRLKVKPHFKWPKVEARARILEAAGGLRFLAQGSGWRSYYRARRISVRCVSRLCEEDDTAHHAKRCKFMETKWMDKYDDDDQLKARYFSRLSSERRRKYGFPIL